MGKETYLRQLGRTESGLPTCSTGILAATSDGGIDKAKLVKILDTIGDDAKVADRILVETHLLYG